MVSLPGERSFHWIPGLGLATNCVSKEGCGDGNLSAVKVCARRGQSSTIPAGVWDPEARRTNYQRLQNPHSLTIPPTVLSHCGNNAESRVGDKSLKSPLQYNVQERKMGRNLNIQCWSNCQVPYHIHKILPLLLSKRIKTKMIMFSFKFGTQNTVYGHRIYLNKQWK